MKHVWAQRSFSQKDLLVQFIVTGHGKAAHSCHGDSRWLLVFSPCRTVSGNVSSFDAARDEKMVSSCVSAGVPGCQRSSPPLCLSTMAWSSSSSWPTSAWRPSWTLAFTPEVCTRVSGRGFSRRPHALASIWAGVMMIDSSPGGCRQRARK